MPKFPAVLFDLDGTLIDSLADIASAMNGALAANGLAVHPLPAYKIFVGDGMDNLALRVLPEGLRADLPLRARLVREMKECYASAWHRQTRPYPGIRDMLGSLAAAGIRLGVLSNKPDAFTQTIVRHFFPDVPWHAVRGQREDTPIKPDPTAPRAIAAAWGLSPADIAYAGDSSTDMLTATNAGMPAIGVTWGFRGREELLAHGARWLADSAEELAALLLGGEPELK